MMHMSAGEERIYKHLRDKGVLTSLEAIRAYGETRLGARVFTLRKKGARIASKLIAVKNRYGERRYVKQYWLEGKGERSDESESIQERLQDL